MHTGLIVEQLSGMISFRSDFQMLSAPRRICPSNNKSLETLVVDVSATQLFISESFSVRRYMYTPVYVQNSNDAFQLRLVHLSSSAHRIYIFLYVAFAKDQQLSQHQTQRQ